MTLHEQSDESENFKAIASAVERGRLDELQALLDAGADLNELDRFGDMTAYAAGYDTVHALPQTMRWLLWTAHLLDFPYTVVGTDGQPIPSPAAHLAGTPTAAAVEAARAARATFTPALPKLRFEFAPGGSGLFVRDRSLPLDLLDVPFSLAQRLARWQEWGEELFAEARADEVSGQVRSEFREEGGEAGGDAAGGCGAGFEDRGGSGNPGPLNTPPEVSSPQQDQLRHRIVQASQAWVVSASMMERGPATASFVGL